MSGILARFGDRLLAELVPKVAAAADECTGCPYEYCCQQCDPTYNFWQKCWEYYTWVGGQRVCIKECGPCDMWGPCMF